MRSAVLCADHCDVWSQMKGEAQAKGKVLPESHKAVRRVRHVVNKVAKVAGNGQGGGYQDHLKACVMCISPCVTWLSTLCDLVVHLVALACIMHT